MMVNFDSTRLYEWVIETCNFTQLAEIGYVWWWEILNYNKETDLDDRNGLVISRIE